MSIRVLLTLDKDEGRFFGGEVVEGTVAVSVTKPTKVTGIKASLVRLDSNGRSTMSLVWVPVDELLQSGAPEPLTVPFSIPTRGDAHGSYRDDRRSVRYFVRASVHRPRLAGHSFAAEREVQLVPLVDADAPAHAVPLHAELRKTRRALGIFFRRGSISASCDVPRSAFVAGDRVTVAVSVANNATDGTVIGEVVARVVEAVVPRSRTTTTTRRLQERTVVDTGNMLHDGAQLAHGGVFNQAVELALPVDGMAPSMTGADFRVEHFVEVHARSPGGRNELLVLRCRFTLGTTRGLPPHVRPRSVSSPFRALDIVDVAGSSSAPIAPQQRGICVVCQEAPCVQCVVPCGHRCLCDHCASSLLASPTKQCPICRRAFQSIIRVYDP